MEAVGRLAGGVAHDFNNLLTVILGYCELLGQRRHCDPGDAVAIAEIRKAGDAAAGLTRQLLAFSRRQVLRTERLDLSATVGQIERLLQRLIGEDVELVTSLVEPGLASIVGDPGQLEQVVVNLVVNARDAMPRGGRLTIATAVEEVDEVAGAVGAEVQPGRYAVLAVSDQGVGIDEQTRARIFEPFFTTKTVAGGTGLGLATVYGIVTQSGGFLVVDSEPDQGSCFKVYLLLVEGAVGAAEQPEPAELRGGSETVLVVEDSHGVRGVARQILENLGYRVLEASDGAIALQIAAERGETIDLMLTDVVIPGLSSSDLAQRLAELRPGIKVLFTSNYTNDAIIRHGVVAGGLEYLQKPFTPASLGRKVREVLDSRA